MAFDNIIREYEGIDIEYKEAKDELPKSIWETYSSFSNTEGGMIVLGVKENKNSKNRFSIQGVGDAEKIVKTFWDTINNTSKVNLNTLNNNDVKIIHIGSKSIIVINVPKANRADKPIYLNNNFRQCYERYGEGDHLMTNDKAKLMFRDAAFSCDDKVLDDVFVNDFNEETIKSYKNRYKLVNIDHPWSDLSNEEFLESIGACKHDYKDKKYHATVAGLLMFGKEYMITRECKYFVDYKEIDEDRLDEFDYRWDDRITSYDGRTSGNVYDLYFAIARKLTRDLKVPFKAKGNERIETTPMHRAIYEALINTFVNADYYGSCGIVINKYKNKIEYINPGYPRVGIEQMKNGGVSDSRNSIIMKMFSLIDIGERAGSGIPKIYQACNEEGIAEPIIEYDYTLDRTKLIINFEKYSLETFFASRQDIINILKNKYDNIKDKEVAILTLINSNNKIEVKDISKELEIELSTTYRCINRLKKKNILEKTKDGWNIN